MRQQLNSVNLPLNIETWPSDMASGYHGWLIAGPKIGWQKLKSLYEVLSC